MQLPVLDPIKPGCNYPFKFLSGCGVAYKFAKADLDKTWEANIFLMNTSTLLRLQQRQTLFLSSERIGFSLGRDLMR